MPDSNDNQNGGPPTGPTTAAAGPPDGPWTPDVSASSERTEYLRFAHDRWWHEDHLVNHRLTWLLTSQALLFAGVGTLINSAKGGLPDAICTVMVGLVHVIIGLGVASAITIALGILAAHCAQRRLHKQYGAVKIKLGVSGATTWGGHLSGLFLPAIFVIAWGFVAHYAWDIKFQFVETSHQSESSEKPNQQVTRLEAEIDSMRSEQAKITTRLLDTVLEFAKPPAPNRAAASPQPPAKSKP